MSLAACDGGHAPRVINNNDMPGNFTPANVTRPALANNSSDEVAAEMAPNAAEEAVILDGLPKPMLGRWSGIDADCRDRASPLRLLIEPKRLRFFESVGMVQSVRSLPEGAVAADVAYSGEGESWHRDQIFTLSDDGDRLTIEGVGADVVRKRCP